MKKKAEVAARLVLVVMSVFIASCKCDQQCPPNTAGATAPSPTPAPVASPPLPDNPTWGRAIVIGKVVDLAAFESKFKDVLGDTDLEAHQIGCTSGCDQLSSAMPPTRLVYIFPREHHDIFAIFGETWDATQRSSGDATFRLEFDADVPPQDCSVDPPHPQPCQAMPYCSDRCGRKVGGCAAC